MWAVISWPFSRASSRRVVETQNGQRFVPLEIHIHMFRQVGVPVLGLIENMNYLACPCCCDTRTPIFGSGGGAQIAAELSVPLWGQVPIDPGLSEAGRAVLTADSLLTGIFEPIAQGLNGTFGSGEWGVETSTPATKNQDLPPTHLSPTPYPF